MIFLLLEANLVYILIPKMFKIKIMMPAKWTLQLATEIKKKKNKTKNEHVFKHQNDYEH